MIWMPNLMTLCRRALHPLSSDGIWLFLGSSEPWNNSNISASNYKLIRFGLVRRSSYTNRRKARAVSLLVDLYVDVDETEWFHDWLIWFVFCWFVGQNYLYCVIGTITHLKLWIELMWSRMKLLINLYLYLYLFLYPRYSLN